MKEILTDQETAFMSQKLCILFKLLGITSILTSVYHPKMDRLAWRTDYMYSLIMRILTIQQVYPVMGIHTETLPTLSWVRGLLRSLRWMGLTGNPKKCTVEWVKVQYVSFPLTTVIVACLRPKKGEAVYGSGWLLLQVCM